MIKLKLGIFLLASGMVGWAVAADPAATSAAAAAPSQMPSADCTAVLDRLSQGIPRAETGPELRSKGLRIAHPILVPEGVITETGIVSGARVRVKLDATGAVIPGSVSVQESVGDPKLPLALSQATPASLQFDVSGAFSVPDEFAFTTVYVVCARR